MQIPNPRMILLSHDIMYTFTALLCITLQCCKQSSVFSKGIHDSIFGLDMIYAVAPLTYQKKKKTVALLFAAFFIDAVIVLFSTGS